MRDPKAPSNTRDQAIRDELDAHDRRFVTSDNRLTTTTRQVRETDVDDPIEGEHIIDWDDGHTHKWYSGGQWRRGDVASVSIERIVHMTGAVRGPTSNQSSLASTIWPGGVIAVSAWMYQDGGTQVNDRECWAGRKKSFGVFGCFAYGDDYMNGYCYYYRDGRAISCSTVGSSLATSEQIAYFSSADLDAIGIVRNRSYTIYATCRGTGGLTDGRVYFKSPTFPSYVSSPGPTKYPTLYLNGGNVDTWFSMEEVSQFLQFGFGETSHWYYSPGDDLELWASVDAGTLELDTIYFVPMKVFSGETDPIGEFIDLHTDPDNIPGVSVFVDGSDNVTWYRDTQALARGTADSAFRPTFSSITQGHSDFINDWGYPVIYNNRQRPWHLYLFAGRDDTTGNQDNGQGYLTLLSGGYTPVAEVQVSARTRGLYYMGPIQPWERPYWLAAWQPDVAGVDWAFPWDWWSGENYSGVIVAGYGILVRDDQTPY